MYSTRQSGIDTYLNTIGRYRLLTADEEITLGKRVQRMIELRDKEGPLTDEEKREVRLGERAKERFVRSNLRLVVNIARKYIRSTRSMDLMDLVQEGNIGLIRGVEKYDPLRGYKFSTYAFWWIRQAMTRAICTKDRTFRLPSTVTDMAMSWSRKVTALTHQLGRTPTNAELAEEFNCTIEEIETFKQRGASRVLSLDATYGDEDDMTLKDVLQDPAALMEGDAVDQVFYSSCKPVLDSALHTLNPREMDMLKRQWGLDNCVPETPANIGRDYSISRERVRQIVNQAQIKLRHRLTNSLV